MNKKSKVVSLATTALIATLLLNANQAKADQMKKNNVNDNDPKTSNVANSNQQTSVKKTQSSKLDKAKQAVSDAQTEFDKDAGKTQVANKSVNDARKEQLKYQSDYDSVWKLQFKAQETETVYKFAQNIQSINQDDFHNSALDRIKFNEEGIQDLENDIKNSNSKINSGYAYIQKIYKSLDKYNRIINNAKSHPGKIDAEKLTTAKYIAITNSEAIAWDSINPMEEKERLSIKESRLAQYQIEQKMYDQLASSYNADQNTKLKLVNNIKNASDQAKAAYEKVGGDLALNAKKTIVDQNKQNIKKLEHQLSNANRDFENSYFALEKAEDQLADIISSEDNDNDDNTNDNTSNNSNYDNNDYFNNIIDNADQSTTSQDTNNTSSTDNTVKKPTTKKTVKKQTKSATKKNTKATSKKKAKKNTRKSNRKSSKSAARRSTKKSVKRAKTAVITIKHNRIYRNGKRLTNKQIRTLLAKKFNLKVKGTYRKHGFITTYDAKGRKMHKRFNLSKKYRILGFKMIHKTLYVRIGKNTYVKYSNMFKK